MCTRARCFLIIVLLGIGVEEGVAQGRGQGYVFGGIGREWGYTTTTQLGVGGEAPVYKGLEAGGELAYSAPARYFSEGFGILSADGSYHFMTSGSSESKAVPFVTAGYSLLFRRGSANAVNFGGGVNYWVRDRVGIRVEFRDHKLTYRGGSSVWGFRLGLAFR